MLQKGCSLMHRRASFPTASMAVPRTGAYLIAIAPAHFSRNMASNWPENNGKGLSFPVAASKEEDAASHAGSGKLQWDSTFATSYASRRREAEPSHGFNPSYFSKGNTNSNTGFKHGMYRNPMEFVRGVLLQDSFQASKYNVEQNPDIVHIKILRNNTFVTVTDSKGNRKVGATLGLVPELKGSSKMSRYAPEATAEYVGRKARDLGLKSVVVKVNGFTYFKKKKQAILSFRDGFAGSHIGPTPIVHIEDTTQLPHNGCRKPKRRRV